MNPRTEAFAGFLDRVYDDCPFDWSKATMLAREIFGKVPLEGRDVLDLGCGVADDRARFFLMDKKAATYLGIDLCRRALEASRLDGGRARVLWADMHQLPLPDASVDLVYCRGVATYAWNLKKAMKEAWRVLRPGGCFVVDFSKPTSALFFVGVASLMLRHLPYALQRRLGLFLARGLAPKMGFAHGKRSGENPAKIRQVIALSLFSPSPARGVSPGWAKQMFHRLGAAHCQVLTVPDSEVFSNKTTFIVSATK